MVENDSKFSIIPIGGLGEIGKNMMVIKFGNNILLVDSGLTFPEDEMLGIDIVIPDISYLIENKDKIKAILLTHGHEDHIGAMPFVLKELNVPVYGTKLTLGLLEVKLKEAGINKKIKLQTIKPRETLKIGPFSIDFFRVSHSIPDCVGLAIHTPIGTIVHSGDFKFDQSPVDDEVIDIGKLAQLGEDGVLVLLSDSTNAEKPGYTLSEKTVGKIFRQAFTQDRGRIIVASFASNIHRLQQIITTAQYHERKVAIVGRSMVNVVEVASEKGYLDIPQDTLIDLDQIGNFPKNKVVIITTGSQGEPMSALTRMAMSDHSRLEIIPGDTVIISANPVPGNEKMVFRIIDQLYKLGAEVIYENVDGVHVSGHGGQEELKIMLNLVKPKFFIPIHGEYRMLMKHSQLAEEIGIPQKNIFVLENGQIVNFTKNSGKKSGKVAAGRVLVDGLGVGDVGNIVLRDRKQLSEDGILIVVVTIDERTGEVLAGPDIISRGFVYVRESEELIEEAKKRVRQVLNNCEKEKITEWSVIKTNVKEILNKFLYEKTKRRPMILPIIMELNKNTR